MTLTEEEARGKKCIQAMPTGYEGRCIASECMAFRWVADVEVWLSGGIVTVCDQCDEDLLSKNVWFDGSYARIKEGRIHRIIASRAFGEVPEGLYVDHIDGDRLNNRRGNLRIVTPQQSAANQAPRGGASSYRGVHQGQNGRWVAQLCSGGVRWCLGTYDTEEEAAKAYDEKAKEVHGEFARLNLTTIENSGRRGYCGLASRPE